MKREIISTAEFRHKLKPKAGKSIGDIATLVGTDRESTIRVQRGLPLLKQEQMAYISLIL